MKPFLVCKTVVVCCALLLAAVSCEKESIVEADPEIVTLDATNVSLLSASVSAQFTLPASLSTDKVEIGVFFSTNKNPLASDYKYSAVKFDGDKFTIDIPNLNPATTYYYRGFIIKDGTYFYGDVKSFTTIDTKDIVFTGDYNSETHVASATLNCAGFEDQVTEVGICYNYKNNPVEKNSKVSVLSFPKDGKVSLELKNIPFGKAYYRAYVKVMGLTYYGETKTFEGNSLISSTEINMDDYSVSVNIAFANGYKGLGMGICFSKYVKNPTTSDQKVYTSNLDSINSCFTACLRNIPCGTIYYRPFITLGEQVIYGDIRSFVKNMKIGQPVDLGLSVMWADVNMGADNPDETGCYYSWGENDEKQIYTVQSYKWAEAYDAGDGYYSYFLTKYLNSTNYARSYDDVDGKTTLDMEDDAAVANWKGNWRVPTPSEINELCSECSFEVLKVNGNDCFKIIGPNGNSILLPCTGYKYSEAVRTYDDELFGYYMSNTLEDGYDPYCYAMIIEQYEGYEYQIINDEIIYSDEKKTFQYFQLTSMVRYYGMSIRPVCSK